jgi:hypothetical protein
MAVIGGKVSKGVLILDFDEKHERGIKDRFVADVDDQSVLNQLAWYRTPSGGFHAYFRTLVSHPNVGLAFNENGQKIIEVKCDGGYVLAPGIQSYGEYKHVGGTTVENLCTLTVAETEMLLAAAKSLDQRSTATDASQQDGEPSDRSHAEAIKAVPIPVEVRTQAFVEHLERSPGALQGQDASGYCYKLAVVGLWDYACPEQAVMDAMYDWGQRGDQTDQQGSHYPWRSDEIRHKVRDAVRDGKPEKYIGDRIWDKDAEAVEAIVKPLSTAAPADDRKKRRRPYTLNELRSLPTAMWHFRDLCVNGLVVMWGQSAQGKSFVALDWALSTATGQPWLGHECVNPGPALYVAAEGAAGILKRCERWLEYHQQPMPAKFHVIPEAYNLLNPLELAELLEAVKSLPEMPSLIVIDPLFRNMVGSDSDPKDMSAFIWSATKLQVVTKATVVILHHTGWNADRERGFSGLRQAADTMLSVEKSGGMEAPLTEGIVVCCRKQKDYPEFAKFGCKCKLVGHGDDASVVITERTDLSAQAQQDQQAEEDRLVYEVIRHLPTDQAAAITVDQVVEASGLKRTKCQTVLERALTAGYALRQRLGTRGSPCAYCLSKSGQELVIRQAGLSLLTGDVSAGTRSG